MTEGGEGLAPDALVQNNLAKENREVSSSNRPNSTPLSSSLKEGEGGQTGQKEAQQSKGSQAPGADASQSEKAGQIPTLQKFLVDQGIKYDELPAEIREKMEVLAKEQDPKKFFDGFVQILRRVTEEQQGNLTSEQKLFFDDLKAKVDAGLARPEDALDALGGYIKNLPPEKLTPDEKKEAEVAVDELKKAASEPNPQLREQKVERGANKLLSILKKIGALILALLGLGIFQAIKEIGSPSSRTAQPMAA